MLRLLRNKKILIFLIFFLAFILRVYKLGTFPVGFHADEVRVGWNALSILKTGKDDWGNRFALYYNTFGDFRPTGIFYATIPSIYLLGKSEFAVRFPAALLGSLTVFPLYFFVRELTKNGKNKKDKGKLALLSSFFLAISPWHISVSRSTSEAVISIFFALFGLYFLVKGINEKKVKGFLFSFLFLLVSYFFYHSVRILAPLFAISLVIILWKRIKTAKVSKYAILVFLGLSLTTFVLASNKEARGRFSQVSIFNDLDVAYELSRMPFEEGPNRVFVARLFHNKPSVYTRRFVNEYAKYLSANFFIGDVAKPARYQTVGVGLLTFVEAFLFLLGLIVIIKKDKNLLIPTLLLLAILPAALTTEDAPNLHRSLFMVPFITIIEAYGFNSLYLVKRFKKGILSLVGFFLIANLVFYLHMYFVHNRVHIPLYRNIGAKELALYLSEVQKEYDKIIITNIPDDPYPWIAFFTGREPEIFNKDAVTRQQGTWTSKNFMFTGLRCPSRDAFEKPEVKRLLVVDAEGCATESNLKERLDVEILTKIFRPDESEVYTLWSRIEE